MMPPCISNTVALNNKTDNAPNVLKATHREWKLIF